MSTDPNSGKVLVNGKYYDYDVAAQMYADLEAAKAAGTFVPSTGGVARPKDR